MNKKNDNWLRDTRKEVTYYDTLSKEECVNKALEQDKKISSIVNFTAKWINNMKLQYDFILSNEFVKELEEQNLVIAFGQSNDCITFMGAIQQDLVKYEGGDIYLSFENELTFDFNKTFEIQYPFEKNAILDITKNNNSMAKMKAIYKKEGNPTWKIESIITHKKIYIWDDTDVYCEGIVFNISDLK